MGFWYPFHWWDMANEIHVAGQTNDLGEFSASVLSPHAIAMLESRDRYLEDFLNQGAGRRYATYVVAAHNSRDSAADFVCTGSNDEVIINQALAACHTLGGGRVLLLEGTYNIGGSGTGVNLYSSTSLIGMGPNATILKLIANANDGVAVIGMAVTPSSGMEVASLTIDGNSANNTNHQIGLQFVDGSLFWGYDIFVKNMTSSAFSCVKNVGGPSQFHLVNIFARDCAQNATGVSIFRFLDSTDIVLSNCIAVGGVASAADNFNFLRCTAVMVSSCVADTGPHIGFTADSSTDVSFVGCSANNCADGFLASNSVYVAHTGCHAFKNQFTSDDSSGNGFLVDAGGGQITYDGCIARDNDTDGFQVRASTPTDVSYRSCTAIGNSQHANNTYSGYRFRTSSATGSIICCVARQGANTNKPAYGVNIAAAACNGTIVVQNDLRTSGATASFNDSGTGTIKNLDGSGNNWNAL